MVPIWVFTQHGFYSVVAAKPSKDQSGQLKKMGVTSDDTHVLVRARVKEDLEDLKATYMPDLVIFTETSADYSHRCYMTRAEWKGILAVSVDELDYDSHFKEASRDGSKGAPGRYSAYMSVWSALANLQSVKPYSGSYAWSSGGGAYSNPSYKGTLATPAKSDPDPNWDDDGQPIGHVRGDYKQGYAFVSTGKFEKKRLGRLPVDIDKAKDTKTTPDGRDTITLPIVRAMLLGKATDDFETDEIKAMNEDAYALFWEADQLPPSKQPVTTTWLDETINQLNDVWADAAEKEAHLDPAEYEIVLNGNEPPSLQDVLDSLPDAPDLTRDTPGGQVPAPTNVRVWDPETKAMVNVPKDSLIAMGKKQTAPAKTSTAPTPKGVKVELNGKTTQVIPT